MELARPSVPLKAEEVLLPINSAAAHAGVLPSSAMQSALLARPIRIQVHLVAIRVAAIRGQLDAIRQPRFNVLGGDPRRRGEARLRHITAKA